MGTWGVAEAKAHFSAVLDKAETEGPQMVTRRKREFLVMTKEQLAEELGLRHPKISMAEFLMRSPLRGSGLELGRVNLRAREVEL
jgi:prevent-host-death family protein